MIRRKKENVEWLEFDILQEHPEVVHGVFLRHGGISKGPFASLNLGGGIGDDPENVKQNRKKVCKCLGVESLVVAKQMHGSKVQQVDKPCTGLECDGLMTNQSDVPLMIKHADCQAALFFDPVNQVIANVHCGWRGSVQNIYRETVVKMQEAFGCDPGHLIVCISPSLGPDHAEFIHYKEELPKNFEPFQVKPTYFDFWEISRMQLEELGIKNEKIEVANLCTFEEKNDFFSYRREKKTGGNATVVVLKLKPMYQEKKRKEV
jgi:purine-nucleoside/S-methyl-5'-thioadenosine phosphorylase / adenosine deaminase